MQRNRSQGFTLIELLIAIVIIGILAGLVVPRVIDILDSARHQSLKPQLRILEAAIDRYYLDTGRYPRELKELIERPENAPYWIGPYVEPDKLADPWGHPVVYSYPGNERSYHLIAYAKDGVAGGVDNNADVSNY